MTGIDLDSYPWVPKYLKNFIEKQTYPAMDLIKVYENVLKSQRIDPVNGDEKRKEALATVVVNAFASLTDDVITNALADRVNDARKIPLDSATVYNTIYDGSMTFHSRRLDTLVSYSQHESGGIPVGLKDFDPYEAVKSEAPQAYIEKLSKRAERHTDWRVRTGEKVSQFDDSLAGRATEGVVGAGVTIHGFKKMRGAMTGEGGFFKKAFKTVFHLGETAVGVVLAADAALGKEHNALRTIVSRVTGGPTR